MANQGNLFGGTPNFPTQDTNQGTQFETTGIHLSGASLTGNTLVLTLTNGTTFMVDLSSISTGGSPAIIDNNGTPQLATGVTAGEILTLLGISDVETLAGLTDTTINNPGGRQYLRYNSTSNRWENVDLEVFSNNLTGTAGTEGEAITWGPSNGFGSVPIAIETVTGTNSAWNPTTKTLDVSNIGTGTGAGIESLVNDPASPSVGEVWYNSTDNVVRYFDGTVTQTVATLVGLNGKQDVLTGVSDVPGLVSALNGKQDSLTGLNDVPGLVAALNDKADNTDVAINNVTGTNPAWNPANNTLDVTNIGNDTTYSVSAGATTTAGNVTLDLDASGSGTDSAVTLAGGTDIDFVRTDAGTITANFTGTSGGGTDTTYSLDVDENATTGAVDLMLDASAGTDSTVTVAGGRDIEVTRVSGTELSIAYTGADTDTTYTMDVESSSTANSADVMLDASSGTDSRVTVTGGTGVGVANTNTNQLTVSYTGGIGDQSDVNLSNVQNDQTLVYNSGTNSFENQNVQRPAILDVNGVPTLMSGITQQEVRSSVDVYSTGETNNQINTAIDNLAGEFTRLVLTGNFTDRAAAEAAIPSGVRYNLSLGAYTGITLGTAAGQWHSGFETGDNFRAVAFHTSDNRDLNFEVEPVSGSVTVAIPVQNSGTGIGDVTTFNFGDNLDATRSGDVVTINGGGGGIEAGTTFPTTRPDGSALQDNDLFNLTATDGSFNAGLYYRTGTTWRGFIKGVKVATGAGAAPVLTGDADSAIIFDASTSANARVIQTASLVEFNWRLPEIASDSVTFSVKTGEVVRNFTTGITYVARMDVDGGTTPQSLTDTNFFVPIAHDALVDANDEVVSSIIGGSNISVINNNGAATIAFSGTVGGQVDAREGTGAQIATTLFTFDAGVFDVTDRGNGEIFISTDNRPVTVFTPRATASWTTTGGPRKSQLTGAETITVVVDTNVPVDFPLGTVSIVSAVVDGTTVAAADLTITGPTGADQTAEQRFTVDHSSFDSAQSITINVDATSGSVTRNLSSSVSQFLPVFFGVLSGDSTTIDTDITATEAQTLMASTDSFSTATDYNLPAGTNHWIVAPVAATTPTPAWHIEFNQFSITVDQTNMNEYRTSDVTIDGVAYRGYNFISNNGSSLIVRGMA